MLPLLIEGLIGGVVLLHKQLLTNCERYCDSSNYLIVSGIEVFGSGIGGLCSRSSEELITSVVLLHKQLLTNCERYLCHRKDLALSKTKDYTALSTV